MSSMSDTLRDNDIRLAELLTTLTDDQWTQHACRPTRSTSPDRRFRRAGSPGAGYRSGLSATTTPG
jgi:hypothetical protein